MIYVPSTSSDWQGRTSLDKGIQYYHEAVKAIDLGHDFAYLIASNNTTAVLTGYACEEGVRRNFGRIGAKAGPQAIRHRLAKLAWHCSLVDLFDGGNFVLEDQQLEVFQEAFAAKIAQIIRSGALSIALGGGHDMAYAHFLGLHQAISKGAQIGVVNVDAHFDLRPVQPEPSSGTPFRQILALCEQQSQSIDYLALGIQESANTPSLFSFAEADSRVRYFTLAQMQASEQWLEAIVQLCQRVDYLYLSIDLDAFSMAVSPGVSAPSVVGVDPWSVKRLIEAMVRNGKLVAFDVAELNPTYDRDEQSARLAAWLIDILLRAMSVE